MRRIWIANVRKYAIVDDEDYDDASQYRWHAYKVGGRLYCQARFKKNGKQVFLSMSKMITKSDRIRYFKDGNSLNFRKSNLSAYVSDVNGKMTNEIKAFILGTLLGDFSLWHSKPLGKRYGLQCTHGDAQKEYLFHKADILSAYVKTAPIGYKAKAKQTFGLGQTHWKLGTVLSSDFRFVDMCHDAKFKKHVSQEWVDSLTLVSLAYWYMDDGYLDRNRYVNFCTHSFSVLECQRLVKRLGEMGFQARIRRVSGRWKGKTRYYPGITMGYLSSEQFLGQIDHLIVDCLKYKCKIDKGIFEEVPCDFCGDMILRKTSKTRRWASCSRKECKTAHAAKLSQAWAANHPKRVKECRKNWYKENKESAKQYSKKWHWENREHVLEYQRKRRAQKRKEKEAV